MPRLRCTEGTAGDFEAERHHLRSEVKNLQSSLVLIGKLHQSMTVEQAKAAGAPVCVTCVTCVARVAWVAHD
jgi:hypothetical protein